MPLIVSLVPDEESQDALRIHVQLAGGIPKDNFHTTVFYAEESPIYMSPEIRGNVRGMLPITLNPATYSVDTFGDIVVLRYEDKTVREINAFLIGEAVRQKVVEWPDLTGKRMQELALTNRVRTSKVHYTFNPHISLAIKDKRTNLDRFRHFRGNIRFTEFIY